VEGKLLYFNFLIDEDWFKLADVLKEEFEEGNYKIIAKAEDWEINVK